MNSISSPNSTKNYILMNYESVKERALSLLKEKSVDRKELLDCCQDLMMIPILDDDIASISYPLLDIDNFEIAKKISTNPVFIRNLLNIVHLINFIWIASKNKIDLFHAILLDLGIMFSYLFRNEKDDKEGVDYALLAPIPNIIYDVIAKNGKNCFKDPQKFNFDEELFSTDINGTQIEYVYQENSISKILSNFTSKQVNICPKIMYYLEYKCAKELFNKNIFNNPENYLNLVHNEKEYNGYNEIDFSFSLSETVTMKENFIFYILKNKNEQLFSRLYSPNEPKDIIFEKDSNIFMEIKSSIKKLNIEEKSNKLKNMSQRFSFAYKNSAYSSLDKKFSKKKICCFLLYDGRRIELFNQISPNINIDKDVEILYNSVNVQISSIVSLQNQIRQTKKEVSKLQEQIKRDREYYDFKFSVIDIKLSNIQEESIKKIVKKCIESNSFSSLNIFKTINNLFIKSSSLLKIIYPEDIIALNDQIIGKKEIDQNYPKLISLLENKINEKTFAEDYYSAYKKTLTGKVYEETNGKKCDFPDCSEEIADILKNILKFIYLLDKDPLLLNSFFASILYYGVAISRNDKMYSQLYLVKFEGSNIKDWVIYLIQSINPSYI